MIRDRKGWIAPTAIMVMTAIVLLAVLLNAYQTTEEVRNNPLGRTQIYMLSKVQDAYRAQTYTDLAAKHALRKAIINAAKNGGYESGAYSECGTYGFFQLWSNRTDKCFPDEEKDVLGTEFEKEIDRYIAAYPEERELIKGVFKTTVNEEDGTEVVAKATLPWRFGELYYPKKLDAFPVQGATKDKFSNDWHMPREEGKRYHLGTDIFAEKGTPVLAAKGGKILRMGCNSYGGNRIGIVDEEGNYFYYAHLDSYQPGIGEGMTVKAGQQIGTVGDTLGCKPGCTGIDCGIEGKTEPHLHFGIYVRPTDQEDTIKQESAYNPYYALVA
ncbi:M23 family metallopeptidase, partial [Candidatus Woesearchaeota archaeon]